MCKSSFRFFLPFLHDKRERSTPLTSFEGGESLKRNRSRIHCKLNRHSHPVAAATDSIKGHRQSLPPSSRSKWLQWHVLLLPTAPPLLPRRKVPKTFFIAGRKNPRPRLPILFPPPFPRNGRLRSTQFLSASRADPLFRTPKNGRERDIVTVSILFLLPQFHLVRSTCPSAA